MAFAIIGPLVFTQLEFSQEMEAINTEANSRAASLTRLLTVSEQLMMERVVASMRLLKDSSKNQFGKPSLDGTVILGGKEIPSLKLGDQAQTNHFELVDNLVAVMGGTATLFVKSGKDFIRVSTNVYKDDGSRAISTLLNPNGKAIAALSLGKPFYGVVDILGTPYITGYEPMLDSVGNVIGAWYVGFKIDMPALREAVEKTRILESGFAAVLDANKQIRLLSAHMPASSAAKYLQPTNQDWVQVHKSITEWNFEVVLAYPISEARAHSMAR